MAALQPIKGTISIALEGQETHAVGAFEVPVSVARDAETGELILNATPNDAVVAAAAAAMREAASLLLDALPSAELSIPEGTNLIRCAECPSTIAYDGKASLEHAEDGAHVFSPTYG